MTWIAPDVARIDEPFTGPERGILEGFLDWHRSTLLWKCAGLTGEQLARVYAHVIEEYARHNGHADLLRERIDGATGP